MSLLAALFAIGSTGCANRPGLTRSGFLSDYSKLEAVSDSRLRYESPIAIEYTRFLLDPVQVLAPVGVFSAEDRQSAIEHFQMRLREAIVSGGLTVVAQPGPGVARVRVALTDIAKSTWWQKVHPVSRMAGAGSGGAAMEGEMVDSLTGEQLGAVIQAGIGNQFDFTAYSTLADVKSAIDQWARIFAERLREIHAPRQEPGP